MVNRSFSVWFAGAAMLLSACADETEQDRTSKVKQPAGQPVIEITSHSDGERILGSREITFAGTLTSPSEITGVTLMLGDVTAPVTWDQATFSAALSLANRGNSISVAAANAAGETTAVTLEVSYPFLTFESGQNASLVIGQPDFESSDTGTGADQMMSPWGHAAYAGGILYLPDYGANRVLGFSSVPSANGASADFVLGQADFGLDVSGYARDRMDQPASVSADGDKMAVALQTERVFLYFSLPQATNALPDVIVGQPSFTGTESNCSAGRLNNINSVRLVNNKLLVADSNNHRVMIWNSLPTQDGEDADLVLGQSDFSTCSAGTGPNGMRYPNDVWSDGKRVVVADSSNDRVLIWNTFPTENGQAPDLVLGQKDLNASGSYATSASTFDWPAYVASNGNQLFLGDCGHRVLVWNSFPSANSAPADRVLGQGSFTGTDNLTTRSTMDCPSGFAFVGDERLLVTDWGGVRYLMFKSLE